LEQLRAGIGDHGIAALHQLGWLELGAEGIRSRVDLSPCCHALLFSDTAFALTPFAEQVYWLGGDSYSLAYCTPRWNCQRALDVCTGSGVHAILAGRHCGQVMGLDINPRALAFSRLNAEMNGQSQVTFQPSDVYSSLESEQRFELITLNPPFVPTPNLVPELYRSGGGSGESVTEKVMRGLNQYLQPGGLFSMATEAPRRGQESPLERMRPWLGEEFALMALYKHEFPLEEYILGHVLASGLAAQEQEAELDRWWSVYEEFGITSMVSMQVLALRGLGRWEIERRFGHPRHDLSKAMEEWLRALQSWANPGPSGLRLSSQVRRLFVSEGEVLVEFLPGWSEQPLVYSGSAARLLKGLQEGQEQAEDRSAALELCKDFVLAAAF